jgi:hypothetical protein
MTPNTIELHIEELVLHGFPPKDRHLIGEAVQRELTKLLSERGIPSSLSKGGEIARLDGGSFNVKQGSKADVVGRQVAQAVYGGMQR